MGTAEKGYTSLGKGLREFTRPIGMDTDFPSTTPEIEGQMRDVESGKGKGGEPRGDVARAHTEGKFQK